MKQCAICKFGEVVAGKTTMTFERDGVTMVIKEVPALVCETCGEAYVTDEIMLQLERIAETAGKEGVQVDIRRFIAA